MTNHQGVSLRLNTTAIGIGLKFQTPTVRIDGEEHHVKWGEHFFPLESGPHTMSVRPSSVRGDAPAGSAMAQRIDKAFVHANFVVRPDHVTQIRFEGGPKVVGLLKGKGGLWRLWVVSE